MVHVVTTFKALETSFKFFPIFLVLGYVRYELNRWEIFLKDGYRVKSSRCAPMWETQDPSRSKRSSLEVRRLCFWRV